MFIEREREREIQIRTHTHKQHRAALRDDDPEAVHADALLQRRGPRPCLIILMIILVIVIVIVIVPVVPIKY